MRYKYFFIYFKLNSKYFAEFIPIYIKCIMNIINNHIKRRKIYLIYYKLLFYEIFDAKK